MTDGAVQYEPIGGGIVRIRLNRPEASNGMDVELLRALNEALLRCHRDATARVAVLTGNGPNFCTGGDVGFRGAGRPAAGVHPRGHRVAADRHRLPDPAGVPVVATVRGFAAGGGGLGLVSASDFVVAARSAKFFSGAVRVGMAPDGGATVTLARLVGLRRALDIVLTNPTLSAERAAEIGLITRVVDDDALEPAALGQAAALAAMPPLAVAATKRLMWGGIGASVDDRLGEEASVVSQLAGTADAREGLAAVIERRPPRFVGA